MKTLTRPGRILGRWPAFKLCVQLSMSQLQ